ncbi:hypothetical protein [Bradyrhizobium sp.]|uniref:hypothetical protein n=1 Tax=Bradyrhizobium sp. TaxID=376 RepID=UPI0039E564BF
MTIFATTLLLASSLALSSPAPLGTTAGVEPNPMLRNAAVDHDLAKVKQRIEQGLREDAADAAKAKPLNISR